MCGTMANQGIALAIGSFIMANTAGIIVATKWLFNQALEFQLTKIKVEHHEAQLLKLQQDITAAHSKIRSINEA